MNLLLYNGTIFFFFQASLLIRILRQFLTKISYGHVTKIPREDGLLSEPTTEVNGNDPKCKRMGILVSNRVKPEEQIDFENIVGQEEIARNKQFLLFPQCFLFNQKLYPHLSIFLTFYLYLLLNWKSLKLACEVKG